MTPCIGENQCISFKNINLIIKSMITLILSVSPAAFISYQLFITDEISVNIYTVWQATTILLQLSTGTD